MFHPKVILGGILVCLAMIIYLWVTKDRQAGYKKAIFGFFLIIVSGIISIINNSILRLWPLSVLGLTLTTIELILAIGGLILIIITSKKNNNKNVTN
jgi:prolipoprotein diacylglyceryltransferase